MGTRAQLQTIFEIMLNSQNVYFQPPTNVQLKYPCIIYERAALDTTFANNIPYTHKTKYQVKLLDTKPDSPLVMALANLPLCEHERFYKADGINHDVYNLYF